MKMVDARAMSISCEDLIAVTKSPVYYREKTGNASFPYFVMTMRIGQSCKLVPVSTKIMA